MGHFQKYSHNTVCLSSKILHKHCFYFLLGPKEVPVENGNDVYECLKFWRTNKEYYGVFESGLFTTCTIPKSNIFRGRGGGVFEYPVY